MSTSTTTQENTSTSTETGSFPDVNHYAPNSEILESIVYGTEVTALCGERFVVEGCGGGETSSASGIICPICAHIANELF